MRAHPRRGRDARRGEGGVRRDQPRRRAPAAQRGRAPGVRLRGRAVRRAVRGGLRRARRARRRARHRGDARGGARVGESRREETRANRVERANRLAVGGARAGRPLAILGSFWRARHLVVGPRVLGRVRQVPRSRRRRRPRARQCALLHPVREVLDERDVLRRVRKRVRGPHRGGRRVRARAQVPPALVPARVRPPVPAPVARRRAGCARSGGPRERPRDVPEQVRGDEPLLQQCRGAGLEPAPFLFASLHGGEVGGLRRRVPVVLPPEALRV